MQVEKFTEYGNLQQVFYKDFPLIESSHFEESLWVGAN